MQPTQLAAVLAASGTWIGFSGIMNSYFRHSRRRTPAKTALLISGFLCTVAQIITLAVTSTPPGPWLWLGLAGYGLANALFWWALAAHGKTHPAFAFIPVAPETLTTAGPYRLVRHPIYTAYLLAWSAAAVIAAQPWLLLAVVWMGVFYVSAALQEEKTFAASAFASGYEEYRRRTGMFVPKVTALLPARRSPAPRLH